MTKKKYKPETLMRLACLPLLLLATPAMAATCPAEAPFAGWEKPAFAAAPADFRNASQSAIEIGQAKRLSLAPAADLAFARLPEKAAPAGSFGGTVSFTVTSAGRYRIGLDQGVWIDVIDGDRPVASVAHGHGPECGPVRKIVDFDLKPGRHLLQLSGAKTATVTLMIAPALSAAR